MEKSKLKWKHILFPIILLAMLVFINCYADPASNYHSDPEQYQAMAEAILSGKEVFLSAGNGNEREFRRFLILDMPDHVDCISVGPSFVMGIRQEMTGEESYYNLGESSADYFDILAQLGLMEENGKRTDRIIFCVDSFFFDDVQIAGFTRNIPFRPYANAMLARLELEAENVSTKTRLKTVSHFIHPAFSITYFQDSVNYIRMCSSFLKTKDRWGLRSKDFDNYKRGYYKTDGSFVYSLNYQGQSVAYVLQDAKDYPIAQKLSKGVPVSEKNKETFERLVQYYQARDVEIELFLCPLAPALWDRIEGEISEYHMVSDLEVFAREIAGRYGLKITGSYNPYTLGISNEDFYDSRHVRHESLTDFFDFTR